LESPHAICTWKTKNLGYTRPPVLRKRNRSMS